MSKLVLRNSEGKIIKEMPFDKNQTNEEWFCALPTKEKAKWLASQQCGHKVMQELKAKAWEEWLKEKHNEIEE